MYHSVPKAFDCFQNSSIPFHRVTFDHSILCVLLKDKLNEICQNSKKIERNAISTARKALKKGNSIALVKTNAPILQTSSHRLKLTKEKLTLHEVNFVEAAKISTIFYQ